MRRDGLKITQLIDKLLSVVGRQPHPDAMMNDIAYEIMGIPAPETRWELLPLLRRHCNGMIIDAMWTLLYNRWLFIEVWESHKEIVEWMFKHHTIQQPARRSSEGKKIPGAHVVIDEYFYTAPYMAASHMRSFGKPRLIVDIQPESWLRDQTFGPFPAPGTALHPLALGTARVPVLSSHLFEPDAEEPYGDMYPRIWSLCRQLVKGQEMAWNTYMETRSNFLQMARSYVQASDLARPGNSLHERALARLHAEGVVVQARLNEIVRIGLLEEPWRAWTLLSQLVFRLEWPLRPRRVRVGQHPLDVFSPTGDRSIPHSRLYDGTRFLAAETLWTNKVGANDARDPYWPRLRNVRPSNGRLHAFHSTPNECSQTSLTKIPRVHHMGGSTTSIEGLLELELEGCERPLCPIEMEDGACRVQPSKTYSQTMVSENLPRLCDHQHETLEQSLSRTGRSQIAQRNEPSLICASTTITRTSLLGQR